MRCLPCGSIPALRGACLGVVVGLLMLGLASAADAPAPGRKEAAALNTAGFKLYNQKKYPEALEKFRAAASADPTYAHAQYNLACTLGILRKQGLVCQHEAYRSAILEPLREAIRLDPRRLKKARKDRDLDSIRDTFGWQLLDGLDLEKPKDLRKILDRVRWYGPAQGVHGSLLELDFHADGKLVLRGKELVEEQVRTYEKRGTYRLNGLLVEVTLDGETRTGGLDIEGKLYVEGLDGPFSDDPGECGV